MSIQTTNKTSWKVLFTVWLFSVFILYLLLLAAGWSPSGAGPRMFISFTSNMGMLDAAGGCSNRSESPCPHWALHRWLRLAPGCLSCRDRHKNLEKCSVLVPVCTDKGLSWVGQEALASVTASLPWKAVHGECFVSKFSPDKALACCSVPWCRYYLSTTYKAGASQFLSTNSHVFAMSVLPLLKHQFLLTF